MIEDERTETVEFYKVSKLKVLEHGEEQEGQAAPWVAAELCGHQGYRPFESRFLCNTSVFGNFSGKMRENRLQIDAIQRGF